MKKKFDAVQFQREVRSKLGRRMEENPKKFLRVLDEKYGALKRIRVKV
jgi:hypothetical protein